MEKLLKQVVGYFTRTAIGLWVYEMDNEVRYFALLLKKTSSGDLEPVLFDEFFAPDQLKVWIEDHGKNAPVIVGLGGKPVLLKQVEGTTQSDPVALLKQLAPGAEPSHLLINASSQSGTKVVSLVRADKYAALLKPLLDQQLNLYDCYIGSGVTLRFRNVLLGEASHERQYGFCRVTDPVGEPFTIRKELPDEMEMVSAELSFSHRYLPSYCLAASYFAGEDATLINQKSEQLSQQDSDYIQRRVFKPYFTSVAAILLAVFMINVYFYMERSAENNRLLERSASTELLVKQYNKMRERYEEKQAIVDQLNYSNIQAAWISDQIGSQVPANVSLTSFRINPLSKNKNKADSPFEQ